jgi:hypothetical protein
MFLFLSVGKSDFFLWIPNLLQVGQALLNVGVVGIDLFFVVLGLGLQMKNKINECVCTLFV